jgi:hypothetical protein
VDAPGVERLGGYANGPSAGDFAVADLDGQQMHNSGPSKAGQHKNLAEREWNSDIGFLPWQFPFSLLPSAAPATFTNKGK